jgi:hypothetical protein
MTLDHRLLCLVSALLVSLPAFARAETDGAPPLPVRKPANVESHLPGDQPSVPWTDAEIEAAKSECDRLLKGMAIEYEQLAPIKEGICGAPAPILVKSIGSDPKVAIDPPATITCPLAAGLYAWLKNKVEPDARAMLGTQVVKLSNASSYVCRNRYGGADTPISEHALANALDVSTFVLASGDHLSVLDTWPRLVTKEPGPKPAPDQGTTGSIIKAVQTTASTGEASGEDAVRLTRIKANPFEAPSPAQEAKPPKQSSSLPTPALESVAAQKKRNPFVAPVPKAKVASVTPQSSAPQASVLAPSVGLPHDKAPGQTLAERQSAFIKEIHDEACGVFGTTLGPAANEAHKNHFHLDMKVRRHAGLCD